MKKLFDYCVQSHSYGDSYGKCLIALENDETIEDVKDEYVNTSRDWWEQKYSNPLAVTSYVHRNTPYVGNLVLLDTYRVYLD